MKFKNSEYPEQKMTDVTASDYARRLVERESKGHGDVDAAMHRLEQRYGIGRWTLAHLRGGRAKTCDYTLFQRLRAAYLDLCESQVRRLQHEIEIEKARGTDASLEHIEEQARDLRSQVQAHKATR